MERGCNELTFSFPKKKAILTSFHLHNSIHPIRQCIVEFHHIHHNGRYILHFYTPIPILLKHGFRFQKFKNIMLCLVGSITDRVQYSELIYFNFLKRKTHGDTVAIPVVVLIGRCLIVARTEKKFFTICRFSHFFSFSRLSLLIFFLFRNFKFPYFLITTVSLELPYPYHNYSNQPVHSLDKSSKRSGKRRSFWTKRVFRN